MLVGEKRYTIRVEREVYKAAYNQAYWARESIERSEAGQPGLFCELRVYMKRLVEADRNAQAAGCTEERIERIHARAMFDALLSISRKGSLRYTEYFVSIERVQGGVNGQYDIASLEGDAPEALQEGKTFRPFQLSEVAALVNCYFVPPITMEEATLVVMELIHRGQLGSYSKIVEEEG